MEVIRSKSFANGVVYALRLKDGLPIEATDTFLPYYTKDAASQKTNVLQDCKLADRHDRWMVGVSTMSGCPVGCKFCATGQLNRWRNLTANEIVDQVLFVLEQNPVFNPATAQEFKINYTRMGEPFLNLDAVREAVERVSHIYPNAHHYISTIGLKGSDFSWVRANVTLQISLHSLHEERRRELIPVSNLMTLTELGEIRTGSNLKTTLNLTLVSEDDFDVDRLKAHFDPSVFFVKLSPINPNPVSEGNSLGLGIIEQVNLI